MKENQPDLARVSIEIKDGMASVDVAGAALDVAYCCAAGINAIAQKTGDSTVMVVDRVLGFLTVFAQVEAEKDNNGNW